MAFCDLVFSLSVMFSGFIQAGAWVSISFLFNGRIIFHFLDIPYFPPFTYWWTFGLFPPFGYCEQCCYKYLFPGFVWAPVFNSLGYIPRSWMTGHSITPDLTYWRIATLFSLPHSWWHTLRSSDITPHLQVPWCRTHVRSIFVGPVVAHLGISVCILHRIHHEERSIRDQPWRVSGSKVPKFGSPTLGPSDAVKFCPGY